MNKENFDYLKEHYARGIDNFNALDQKIAQAIAANTLVLSFVFDKANRANSFFLFIFGLFLIIVSLGVCIFAFKTKKLLDAPTPETYSDKDEQIKADLELSLKKALAHNLQVQEAKATFFDMSLIILFAGLVLVVVGVYV